MRTLAIGGFSAGEMIDSSGEYEGDIAPVLVRRPLQSSELEVMNRTTLETTDRELYVLKRFTINGGRKENFAERDYWFWVEVELSKDIHTWLRELIANYRPVVQTLTERK